jgi:CRISPR/Cas system-associated endoribonuclease Cas2
MTCYIISYDLIGEKNYKELYDAMKSYKNWAKITESTWALVSEKSAVDVREHLKKFIDSDDRIFVVKSGTEAAWNNVICSNEWLKENL